VVAGSWKYEVEGKRELMSRDILYNRMSFKKNKTKQKKVDFSRKLKWREQKKGPR
jgi:hypothetical protein